MRAWAAAEAAALDAGSYADGGFSLSDGTMDVDSPAGERGAARDRAHAKAEAELLAHRAVLRMWVAWLAGAGAGGVSGFLLSDGFILD